MAPVAWEASGLKFQPPVYSNLSWRQKASTGGKGKEKDYSHGPAVATRWAIALTILHLYDDCTVSTKFVSFHSKR